MKKFCSLLAAIATVLSMTMLLPGCSGSNTLIITITPSVSTSTTPLRQNGTFSVTFTADQNLPVATTMTVRSSTLINLRNSPQSCTIAAGSRTCSTPTINIDAAENPVTHILNFSSNNQQAVIDPTSLPLTVTGALALSITDPTDGVNQGPSAEDITVTNVDPLTDVTIDNATVGDSSTSRNNAQASSAFEVYTGNSVGNWCKTGCSANSCIVDDVRRTLKPGESCRLYIRTTKDTGTTVGTSLSTYLNVTSTNGNTTRIMIANTPILYAGGTFTSAGGNEGIEYIGRWNGTNWSAVGGGVNGAVRALTTDPIGNLYATGDFTTAGGLSANRIARFDGNSWFALGSGLNATGRALAFDNTSGNINSGSLYVGGSFSDAGGLSKNLIARWDGSGWFPLTPNSQDVGLTGNNVFALAVGPSGNVYVGGSFSTSKDGKTLNNITIWNPTTFTWIPLITSGGQTGVSSGVFALAVNSTNDFYIGGDFSSDGAQTLNFIANWDGSNWNPIVNGTGDIGLDGNVNALGIDTSGKINIAGSFQATSNSGQTLNNIAIWDPTNSTLAAVTSNGQTGVGGAAIFALVIDALDNTYVGGNFTTAGGQTINRIARWNINNNSWSALSSGVNGSVFALTILNTYSDSLT
ncbi:MAG: hypothetical protein AAGA27_02655 [Pseudomonadota bacterium]